MIVSSITWVNLDSKKAGEAVLSDLYHAMGTALCSESVQKVHLRRLLTLSPLKIRLLTSKYPPRLRQGFVGRGGVFLGSQPEF